MIPAMSIVLTLLSGIAVLAVWRGPLTTPKAWAVVAASASVVALGLRLGAPAAPPRARARSAGSSTTSSASSRTKAFAALMGVQFLAQAGQGVVQGAIGKSIAFGGEKGFDVSTVPSADYLLKVVLALYVPYTLISPFIGVFIDRFERRKVVAWTNVIVAAIVTGVAVLVMLPLGKATSEGNVGATVGLILGAARGPGLRPGGPRGEVRRDPRRPRRARTCSRATALSQAGGALFQVFGHRVRAGGGRGRCRRGSWSWAARPSCWSRRSSPDGCSTSKRVSTRRPSRRRPRGSFTTSWPGIKEVAARKPAALGLTSFQMLRYQFWGFGLFTFALYAKNLVQGGDASSMALAISGGGGMVGRRDRPGAWRRS